MNPKEAALLIRVDDQVGALSQLTRVLAEHRVNISYVDILERGDRRAAVYFELQDVSDISSLCQELKSLPVVHAIEEAEPFLKIYGKRIIIMGGGAQVGQVAVGAISEADRHNIRGERISVDTIPLVGEKELAGAVRAVARLPRARVLVMAGALMGGEITRAIEEIKQKGILVISLNMAGSVPDAADLVVSDPIQAGVMAVMAIAHTAKFNVDRLNRRKF
jgi:energy-converting hydrogenase B subunit Q